MTQAEPGTVLAVDDEPDVGDASKAQFEADDGVETAYSGREVLEKVDASVTLVLLDGRMPGISGDEGLEEIRDRELGGGVALVIAVDPDFDIIDMPFDEYSPTPVSRDDLSDTIDSLL